MDPAFNLTILYDPINPTPFGSFVTYLAPAGITLTYNHPGALPLANIIVQGIVITGVPAPSFQSTGAQLFVF